MNRCTNGQYSVSGTIGQPDAGAMGGGSYSVAGGENQVIVSPVTEDRFFRLRWPY